MSPQSLTDDGLVDQLKSAGAAAATGAPDQAEQLDDPRLTVRELQLAIEAARGLAGRGSRPVTASAASVAGEEGAERGRALQRPAVLEGNPPEMRAIVTSRVAASIAVTAATPADHLPADTGSAGRSRHEPWLPDHDGPVSLAGAAAPRTRTARRTAVTPDKAARRPAKQGASRRLPVAVLDPALVAAAVSAPPRLIVMAACGGTGATTATVLLAAALAPTTGVLLVASGADRGSLSLYARSIGGDVAALTAWTTDHSGQPLHPSTPGMGAGNAGTDRLIVAAGGRDDPGRPFDPETAAALTMSAASSAASVLLDWSSPTPPPQRLWSTTTHVLVVAPATARGLLEVEYLVQTLEAIKPDRTPLSVLTVDVGGRAPRRAARAAHARLKALHLPVTALPYDPAIAGDPRVHWPSLRRQTRSAVVATLATVVHADGDDPTAPDRKDGS